MTGETDVRLWLIQRLSDELKIPSDRIDPQRGFIDYGIDSAAAIGVVADLEDHLGRALDPQLFYEYPTIQELAKHVALVERDQGATGTATEIQPVA